MSYLFSSPQLSEEGWGGKVEMAGVKSFGVSAPDSGVTLLLLFMDLPQCFNRENALKRVLIASKATITATRGRRYGGVEDEEGETELVERKGAIDEEGEIVGGKKRAEDKNTDAVIDAATDVVLDAVIEAVVEAVAVVDAEIDAIIVDENTEIDAATDVVVDAVINVVKDTVIDAVEEAEIDAVVDTVAVENSVNDAIILDVDEKADAVTDAVLETLQEFPTPTIEHAPQLLKIAEEEQQRPKKN